MRKLLAISTVVAAALVACSTFGSGDDDTPPPANDDSGPPDTSSSGDGPAIDGAGSDGGADFDAADASDDRCDLSQPKGLFYEATLDNQDCEGWQVLYGTIEAVASPARCGAGACRVCAINGLEPILNRDVPVNRPDGVLELRFQVRGDTMTGNVSPGIYIYEADGGAQIGYGGNAVALAQGSWSPVQVISTPYVGTAGRVHVRIGSVVDAGNSCYFVDEIRVGHY